MATHSGILAWEIPCTEKPGGLQSTVSQRTGHNLATERTRRHPMRVQGSLSVVSATELEFRSNPWPCSLPWRRESKARDGALTSFESLCGS